VFLSNKAAFLPAGGLYQTLTTEFDMPLATVRSPSVFAHWRLALAPPTLRRSETVPARARSRAQDISNSVLSKIMLFSMGLSCRKYKHFMRWVEVG